MTVRVSKPAFNLREKLSELDKPSGIKGNELLRSETTQEVRDLISAGRRNMVINGSFLIDQRNAGSELSITGNSLFSADRWTHNNDAFTYYKTQRKNDADIATIGTEYYLRATITTATSVGSNQSHQIENNLEGYTVKHLNLGTQGAKQCTLSFWVRCSITGLFGGSLQNSAYNRCHPFSYTVDTADTWEHKTFTFNTYGFTTGSFNTAEGVGLRLVFSLGNGNSRQGSTDRWHTSVIGFAPTGETRLVETNGATLDIAQVQLELGTTATEFEHRPYAEELALCQRYYWKLDDGANNPGAQWLYMIGDAGNLQYRRATVNHPVPMRGSPSVTNISLTNNGSTVGVQFNGNHTTTIYANGIGGGITEVTYAEFNVEL